MAIKSKSKFTSGASGKKGSSVKISKLYGSAAAIKEAFNEERAEKEGKLNNIPRSFCFSLTKNSSNVKALIDATRRMLAPWNAVNLKTSKRTNELKDLLYVAGPLGITHMFVYEQKKSGLFMKLCQCRKGTGPTLTFKVQSYALPNAVNRLPVDKRIFSHVPLVIMSGFNKVKDDCVIQDESLRSIIKMAITTIYPQLSSENIEEAQDMRRVVFFDFKSDNTLCMRQYLVSTALQELGETRMCTNTEKNAKRSELGGGMIDEEQERSLVTDPDSLTEIGPRIDLSLEAIHSGMFGGDMLWSNGDSRYESVEGVKLSKWITTRVDGAGRIVDVEGLSDDEDDRTDDEEAKKKKTRLRKQLVDGDDGYSSAEEEFDPLLEL